MLVPTQPPAVRHFERARDEMEVLRVRRASTDGRWGLSDQFGKFFDEDDTQRRVFLRSSRNKHDLLTIMVCS